MMSKGIHRQWGDYDMLYFCPENRIVWQYDRTGTIHKYLDMPTYGLPRKIIEEKKWGK